VHNLIRLGKGWSKTVYVEEFINGRSTLFELISIYVGCLEEDEFCGEPSMLRAFQRFLERVANFDKLHVVFDYFSDEVPHDILNQKPLVLDPSNFYNNFASGISKDTIRQLKSCARFSIDQLNNSFNEPSINVDRLFYPKPDVITAHVVYNSIPIGTLFFLRIIDNVENIFPNMKVHNDDNVNPKGNEVIKHFILHNINLSDGYFPTKKTLVNYVRNIVNINVLGQGQGMYQKCICLRANEEPDEYCDVSFEMPVGPWLVILDVKWD